MSEKTFSQLQAELDEAHNAYMEWGDKARYDEALAALNAYSPQPQPVDETEAAVKGALAEVRHWASEQAALRQQDGDTVDYGAQSYGMLVGYELFSARMALCEAWDNASPAVQDKYRNLPEVARAQMAVALG